jgi:hypothetical protein
MIICTILELEHVYHYKMNLLCLKHNKVQFTITSTYYNQIYRLLVSLSRA